MPSLEKILIITNHRRHRRRAVPMLLQSKLAERLGRKKVKLYLDIALKRSKISQQPLIELLVHMYFGRHLAQTKAMLRADYFGMADESARKLGLELVTSMIRKMRRDLGQGVQAALEFRSPNYVPPKPVPIIDSLVVHHLALLPRLRPDRVTLEDARRAVFDLIRARI